MTTASEPDSAQMIHRLAAVLKQTEFAWTLCLVGEDHASKLAELAGDLNEDFSATGDGKQIASGFSYWGIEPTVAWARAVSDPLYPVARSSIESFYPRWRELVAPVTPLPAHYVSFGPGTGEKDHAVLRSLKRQGPIGSYIPVDMSAEMLRRAVHESIADETVSRDVVIPVQLDFADASNLTELRTLLDIVTDGEPVLFSLLGNTISNFPDVRSFLAELARLMRPGDRFVIEAATTRELNDRWAEAAAKEYRRSAAFRTFVHQFSDPLHEPAVRHGQRQLRRKRGERRIPADQGDLPEQLGGGGALLAAGPEPGDLQTEGHHPPAHDAQVPARQPARRVPVLRSERPGGQVHRLQRRTRRPALRDGPVPARTSRHPGRGAGARGGAVAEASLNRDATGAGGAAGTVRAPRVSLRRISLSRSIAWATFGLLLASGVLSIVWFTAMNGSSRFEPAVETLGIVGGISGVFAERQAKSRELRSLTVSTIVDELDANALILADRAFRSRMMRPGVPQLYPRLHTSALDAAFATGAALALGDPRAVELLHRWRDTVIEFNRRLDLTELRQVIVGERREFGDLHLALTRPGGWHQDLVAKLEELRAHLASVFPDAMESAPSPSPPLPKRG
jgi:SAM-dependent methyltransferase